MKIARDATIVPFGTIEVMGVIETPNHYKCVNVVIDDLPEDQCCKDIVIAQQLQVLKPGSNKILVVIRNLSCRNLYLKKGNGKAHVEASNIVPPRVSSQMPENVLEQGVGNALKNILLENLLKEKEHQIQKIFESLNLQCVESWNEQQQQSA